MTEVRLVYDSESLIDDCLDGRYGHARKYDLSRYLGGEGSWIIRGWCLVRTAKTMVYLNLADRTCFVFVLLSAKGSEPKAWILEDIGSVVDTASKQLVDKDFVKFYNKVAPYLLKIK